MESFKNMLPPQATVCRDGAKESKIEASELVPGDIVLVKAGEQVTKRDTHVQKNNSKKKKQKKQKTLTFIYVYLDTHAHMHIHN